MQDADGSPREDEIVAELLAVAPDVFTAERNKRAAALAPTEPDLANRITKIRKPTIAVWLINQLASASMLSEAIDLAAELQDAAAARDSAAMSSLNRQRRTLVAALADEAAARAAGHNISVSAAARTDIEATLNAAITDPAAAAAVLTARLLRPLAPTGFGHIDLSDAVAGTPPAHAPKAVGGPAGDVEDDLAHRRSRKAAERALRAAEQDADQAARELARAEAELRTARERRTHLAERIQQVQQTLANLEQEAETSAAAVQRLTRAQEQASNRARSSTRQLARSKAALPDHPCSTLSG